MSNWAKFVSELFDFKSLDFTMTVRSMCFVKSDDADVPVRLLKCDDRHFIRDTRPREISHGLTREMHANLCVTIPWKDVSVPNRK